MAESYDFPIRPPVSRGLKSGPYLAFPDEHGEWVIANWDGDNFWSEASGQVVVPIIWFGFPDLARTTGSHPAL
jgi:hypothetical protein